MIDSLIGLSPANHNDYLRTAKTKKVSPCKLLEAEKLELVSELSRLLQSRLETWLTDIIEPCDLFKSVD